MTSKVTIHTAKYPSGQEPDLIIPKDYQKFRFVLGKKGRNPLVAICMNPSAAREDASDATINRVIRTSQKLDYNGWIVVNLYPERSTKVNNMDDFNEELHKQNMIEIENVIDAFEIKQLWGAWGNMTHKNLITAKKDLMRLLYKKGVKVFHFGALLKSGNPHHPLYLKIDKDNLQEMAIEL